MYMNSGTIQEGKNNSSMAASSSVTSSVKNDNNTADDAASSRKLLVSFDDRAAVTGNQLTVQTDKLVVEKQVVVTPSPANNSPSGQFAHPYPDFSPSTLSSPTLSHLQRKVEKHLHISTDTYATDDAATFHVGINRHSPLVKDSPQNPSVPTSIEGTILTPSTNTAHALRGIIDVSLVEEAVYNTHERVVPSSNQIVRIRKPDTIASKSPRPHPIYTTDRFINPNRVQRHTQKLRNPTNSMYSPKLPPLLVSLAQNHPTTLENTTRDSFTENQENLNPNLPL